MFEKIEKFQLFIAGLAVLIVIGILIFPVIKAFNTDTYVVTITDKSYSGKNDGYIIWGEDKYGTQYEFSNNDQWLRGKFNSGTIQGQIKVGNKYRLTTSGWRIPLFSEYPNVIDYELIESKK